jgi:recombination protein RecA
MVDNIVKDIKEDSKKLNALKTELMKKHGKDTFADFSGNKLTKVKSVSSGSYAIDYALGVGGWPLGRQIELYGLESSSKTTIALHAIAEFQKAGYQCAFIDYEASYDPVYAQAVGIDNEALWFVQPYSAEQGLGVAEDLIKSGMFGLVVVDSIAAMAPQAELDGEMGQAHMTLVARLMGQACRKLGALCNQKETSIMWINQVRDSMNPYGSPITTPGGKALKFWASVRIQTKRKEVIGGNGQADPTGNKFLIKVVKNKVAAPFKEAEYEIVFGEGIDRLGEIVDFGVKYGVLQKAGSWYSYNEERIGQGKVRVKEWLSENPEITEAIDKLIKEKLYA